MSRDAVLGYQEKRRQQIADQQEKANERYDFEVYWREFIAAGGKERNAEASWQAHRSRAREDQGRT